MRAGGRAKTPEGSMGKKAALATAPLALKAASEPEKAPICIARYRVVSKRRPLVFENRGPSV